MARKKNKQSDKQNQQFNNNPFSNLKGFAVSAEPTPLQPAAKAERSKTAENVSEPQVSGSDEDLFAREMARMGVQGQGARGSGQAPRQSQDVPEDDGEAFGEEHEDDQQVFLDALGGFDTVFRDEIPEDEERRATPRRMKLLRQGRLAPEGRLDLHGLTREDAREKVRFFLEDSVYQGLQTVLIVTGRGNRSTGEPVLRTDVERYLDFEAKAWVAEWGRAPGQYGGQGAIVAFLHKRKKG